MTSNMDMVKQHFAQDHDNDKYSRRVIHNDSHPRGVVRFGCCALCSVLGLVFCSAFNITKYSYQFGLTKLRPTHFGGK